MNESTGTKDMLRELATLRREVHVLGLRVANLEAERMEVSDAIIGIARPSDFPTAPRDDKLKLAFIAMSPRHHATLQMIMRGASNQEIGDRFGVGEPGAKTYTNGLYKHLGIVGKGPHNKRH